MEKTTTKKSRSAGTTTLLVFTTALNLIGLVLLIYVLYFLYRPTPVKQALIKTFDLRPNVEPGDGIEEELFTDPETGYTESIYYFRNPNNRTDRFIISIPGGGFIVSLPSFTSFRSMKNLNQDVVTFNYPVLFHTKTQVTLQFILNTVDHIMAVYQKEWGVNIKVSLMGTSAGGYYASKLLNSDRYLNDEQNKYTFIDRFIGICGYYGYTSTDNTTLRTIDRFYLNRWNNWLSPERGTCKRLPSTINTIFMTAESDFLKQCTDRYSQLHSQLPLVFEGEHTFFSMTESPSTQKAYEVFVDYVNANLESW